MSLHWSSLRHIAKSPMHYQQALKDGVTVTKAMMFGTAVHEIALAQEHSFVVYDGQRRGNVWKNFKEANAGMDILTVPEYDAAKTCAASVWANPEANKLLASGKYEVPLRWQYNGVDCEGRADILGAALADLKVTTDASPERFPYHARKLLWDVQLAWYLDGMVAAGHDEPQRISLIAVESKPPYPVTVFDLTEAAIESGRARWRELFDRLCWCEENGRWPGYADGPVPLDAYEYGDVIWEENTDE